MSVDKTEMYFMYFPAFLAHVLGPYEEVNNDNPPSAVGNRVRLWLRHPRSKGIEYCRDHTILVDLGKTPSWAGNIADRWEKIEVDDYCNNIVPDNRGFTTLGPAAPHIYGAAGIYLSFSYLSHHCDVFQKADPPDFLESSLADAYQGRTVERLCYVTRLGENTRRYHGFWKKEDLGVIDTGSGRRMLSIAHAGASFERRAPRLVLAATDDLFVPQGEIKLPCEQSKSASLFDANTGDLFLSLDLVRISDLDVPKKPSGSGVRTSPIRGEGLHLIAGGSLNILAYDSSGELARIADTLHPNYFCLKHHGLDELLNIPSDQKFSSLDLIGHSNKDSVLKLSEIPIDTRTIPLLFHQKIVKHIRAMGISQIRLLGCHTACGPQSREIASALYNCLNADLEGNGMVIEVLGTRADIFHVHYMEQVGFYDTRLLVAGDVFRYGHAGESPQQDDTIPLETINLPPGALPSSIERLPLARDITLQAVDYIHFHNPHAHLGDIINLVECDTPYADTPYPPATLQVAISDGKGGSIRSFDVVLATDGGTLPAGTNNFDRIRLSWPDRWESYEIRAVASSAASPGKQLIELIKRVAV